MSHLTPQEQKALAAYKDLVLKALPAEKVEFVLFGSRARNEGDERSDLDVLVLVEEETRRNRDTAHEAVADIWVQFDVDISPLVVSRARFHQLRNRERALAIDIDRDGVRL